MKHLRGKKTTTFFHAYGAVCWVMMSQQIYLSMLRNLTHLSYI